MTIGIAVVGCGLVGAKRVAALPDSARLVSVFDVDETRARKLADELPGVDVERRAEDAFARDDVGLVIVATPHRELPAIAVAAIEAGRDVLVEKPGAADLTGARAVADAADARRRIARVGFNHRFHPALLETRRLVRDGGYGSLLHLRGRYGHGGRLGYEREWRADRAISGGGELIDQGIHLIDLTRFLVGDVALAFAELRTSFWRMNVEDNAFLALRAEAGAFAWLHASWTEWKNLFSLEVTLERAKLEVTGLGGSYGTETLTVYEMLPEMGPPRTYRREYTEPDGSWRRELEDVLDALEGAPSIGATAYDAVAALTVLDAAYAAAG